jgi:ADP-ribose pyrophosphatase
MPFHGFIREEDGWERVGGDALLSTPYLEVERVMVRTPTRSEPIPWTVVYRKAAVVVVPLTGDGRFAMVRQERVPVRASLWEFPAGQIDQAGAHGADVIRAAGLRELREESGLELGPGGDLVCLGHFFPSAGFTDEHSHLLLARPVVKSAGGSSPDAMEAITECGLFTAAELRAMVASGEVRDANSLSAFARLCARGIL